MRDLVWDSTAKGKVSLTDGEGITLDLGPLGTVEVGRDYNTINIHVRKADVKFRGRYVELDLEVK